MAMKDAHQRVAVAGGAQEMRLMTRLIIISPHSLHSNH
mgnify:CR=1 FL=1